MGGASSLRASDAERDAVAAQLRDHYASGRLDIDEFHGRLDRVYGARTHGELDLALEDLPRAHLNVGWGVLAQIRGRSEQQRRERYRRGWIRYLWVNAAAWCLWSLQALGSFTHHPPFVWPVLITVPWGIRRILRTPRASPPAQLSP